MAGFSVEVENLYDVGQKKLPQIAEQLGQAQQKLTGISGSATSSMWTATYGSGGGHFDGVMASCEAATNSMSDAIDGNKTAVEMLGAAFVKMAEVYRKLDGMD